MVTAKSKRAKIAEIRKVLAELPEDELRSVLDFATYLRMREARGDFDHELVSLAEEAERKPSSEQLASFERGMADIKAGRVAPHHEVTERFKKRARG